MHNKSFKPLAVLLLFLWLGRSSGCGGGPQPVDCTVSDWSAWSQCTKTCERGTQHRSRNITRTLKNGGKRCPSTLSESRNCNVMLCPVNCQWGEWSAWDNCSEIGQNYKSRVRNVARPALFGGVICAGTDNQIDACQPDYVNPVIECGTNEFLCQDGLTCVRNELRCNGDDDCTDNSDELNCSQIRSPCSKSQHLKFIRNIDIAGTGFDIVTGKEKGQIMDNLRYNGRCTPVTSGNGDLRLPANLQFYRFQGKVDQNLVTRRYQSEASFFQAEKTGIQKKIQSGVFVSIAGLFDLSIAVALSSDKDQRSIVQLSADTNSTYFKIQNVIQVAEFRTVRENLILAHDFRHEEAGLPEEYDFVKYSRIIEDFGTHYFSQGLLGGTWEYVYRYNSYELQKSGLSESEQSNCLQFEVSAKLFGKPSVNGIDICSGNQFIKEHGGNFIAAAEEATLNVKGGSSDTRDYASWAETVKDNVAVIDYELTPISVVFTSAKKRANMERALYDYLKIFDPKNCAVECENGGSQVVGEGGKECACLCAPGFDGISCSERSWQPPIVSRSLLGHAVNLIMQIYQAPISLFTTFGQM